ncbi:hypothetical protein ACIQZB_33030 [Streptomyces sp. NPDC097727]|uniref:hypothetical protein n=1 Tax=Streptomyces sp. NPDC097727 TaxID=3366092 RepID=UPI00382F0EE5
MTWRHKTERRLRIGGPYGVSYCSGSGSDRIAGKHDAAQGTGTGSNGLVSEQRVVEGRNRRVYRATEAGNTAPAEDRPRPEPACRSCTASEGLA